jgi:thioredoxin 1
MMAWLVTVVAQCPCSGDGSGSGGGINQAAVWVMLALAVGLWHAVKWTKRTWNIQGTANMWRFAKIGLIVALVGALGVVAGTQFMGRPATADQAAATPSAAQAGKIPKLLDLGSKSCIPCKMMAPILEGMKKDYAGKFEVEFIDVWVKENAAKAKEFGIKLIPTQIFFDASGKELWRHEGYISKEDIMAKWRELGYDFSKATVSGPDTQGASSPTAN